MALRLAAETAKVIFETKPDKIGFLTIRADGLVALALEWSDAFRAGQEERVAELKRMAEEQEIRFRDQPEQYALGRADGIATLKNVFCALPLEGDDEV